MVDLNKFAVQGTPVARDLGTAAPKMDDLIKNLGTVSTAANESFPSLGEALERGRPALITARPLIQDLSKLGTQAGPATKNLDLLTASLQQTKGVERINDFLYYLATEHERVRLDRALPARRAGHQQLLDLRAHAGLERELQRPLLQRLRRRGADLSAHNAKFDAKAQQSKGSVSPQGTLLQGLIGTGDTAQQTRDREQGLERLRQGANGQSKALGGEEPMLDYLLGGGR